MLFTLDAFLYEGDDYNAEKWGLIYFLRYLLHNPKPSETKVFTPTSPSQRGESVQVVVPRKGI